MFSYLRWKKHAFLMAGKGSGDWWLPPGLEVTDCIAAYQFKDVENETIAKTNLVNPETYTIRNDNSATWDVDNGYFLQNTKYLNSSGIQNETQIGTMIVRYALPNNDNDELIQMTNIHIGGKYDSYYHFVYAARFKISYIKNGEQQYTASSKPGIVYQWLGQSASASNSDYQILKYALGNQDVTQTGVLGASVWLNSSDKKTCGLWLDGTKITDSNSFKTITGVTQIVNSGMGNINSQSLSPSATGHYVIAAAYYKPNLSTEQHAYVAEAMLDI